MIPAEASLWDYRCSFIGNHDGDSVTLRVDQGFGTSRVTQEGLRLKDVYAPELRETGGADVRDFVSAWFDRKATEEFWNDWPFMLRTEMTKGGTRERVTLGRYIGIVWFPSDPISLNEAVNAYVIEKGYSRGTGFAGSKPVEP